jgi:hypothetical protein
MKLLYIFLRIVIILLPLCYNIIIISLHLFDECYVIMLLELNAFKAYIFFYSRLDYFETSVGQLQSTLCQLGVEWSFFHLKFIK